MQAATMPEFGWDEVQDRLGVANKAELVAKSQNLMSIFASLKLCKFHFCGGLKLTQMLEWFNAVTGWDFTQSEFMKTGERIYNLKRMYNVRCGVSRNDDTVPTRMLREKRGEGGSADNLPQFESMLDEYYSYRGWDKSGAPTPATLEELHPQTVPARA